MTAKTRSFALAAAMLLLASFQTRAEDKLTAENVQRTKSATVFIKHSGGTGSGFFVSHDGLIATNFHVIRPYTVDKTGAVQGMQLRNLEVVVDSGQPTEKSYPARLLMWHPKEDLALLKVEAQGVPLWPRATKDLIETQDIWAFGYPLGAQLGYHGNPEITVTRGQVTSLRRDSAGGLVHIQIDAAVSVGNSGGPVMAADGKVIGIVVSSRPWADPLRGIPAQNINQAIPVERLAELLALPRTHAGTSGNVDLLELSRLSLLNVRNPGLAMGFMKTCLSSNPGLWTAFQNDPTFDPLWALPETRAFYPGFAAGIRQAEGMTEMAVAFQQGAPLTGVWILPAYRFRDQWYPAGGAVSCNRWDANTAPIILRNIAPAEVPISQVTHLRVAVLSDQCFVQPFYVPVAGKWVPKDIPVEGINHSIDGRIRRVVNDGWAGPGAGLGPTHISFTETRDPNAANPLILKILQIPGGMWVFTFHKMPRRLEDVTLTVRASDGASRNTEATTRMPFWAPGAIERVWVPLTDTKTFALEVKSKTFNDTIRLPLPPPPLAPRKP
jgi:hypothetical protein